MAKDVLCEVNSCTHWVNDNRCGANSIYIVSKSPASTHTSEETDCKTFEAK